jgi:hypothetical protein
MAISVDYTTFIITIPQSDLTLVSGTFYTLDTDVFRLQLKDWEASVPGMAELKTHSHNTEVTIAGTTYARTIEILSPYSVEFEDGVYSVQLEGSNNNIWSVGDGILVQNSVQVIPTNSAGLIVSSGSSSSNVWSESEKDEALAYSQKASDNAEQANQKL